MKASRYQDLMVNPSAILTDAERLSGYHFCPDWDFLLIGPDFAELDGCVCKNTAVRRGAGMHTGRASNATDYSGSSLADALGDGPQPPKQERS